MNNQHAFFGPKIMEKKKTPLKPQDFEANRSGKIGHRGVGSSREMSI